MAIASFVISVFSLVEARKSRKQQQKAARLQEKRGRLEAARQTTEQIRQAQIARAQLIQQAEDQGVQESSPVQGALGSIQSRTGGNIAFAQQIFNLQQQANARILSANLALGRSRGFGQLAGVVASTDFSKIFRTSGSPAPVETSTPVAGPGI